MSIIGRPGRVGFPPPFRDGRLTAWDSFDLPVALALTTLWAWIA